MWLYGWHLVLQAIHLVFSQFGSFAVSHIRSYVWQVAQLVAEHEPQEELPPIGLDGPSLFLEKQAKEDNIRSALL